MPGGRGFARRVTLESLPTFAALLRLPGQPSAEEEDRDDSAVSPPERGPVESLDDEALERALGLFRGQPIRVPQPYQRAGRARPTEGTGSPPFGRTVGTAGRAGGTVGTPIRDLAPVGVLGNPIWRKTRLPASDVQRQQGNPTGGIRLTQARFALPNGERIDQTTYFRQDLFGLLPWRGIRTNPFVEAAHVPMWVLLKGQDFGVRDMMVSHKPTGEAGQHNYTTILHWGDLADTVRQLDLRGLTLELFAPPAGDTAMFTLRVQ